MRFCLGRVPEAVATASGVGYTALLAEPDDIIIRVQASSRFTETAARVRLVEGASWNEALAGALVRTVANALEHVLREAPYARVFRGHGLTSRTSTATIRP